MFEVLSINSHTGAQPSMPLIDGLVDNTLLETRTRRSQALHPCIVCYRATLKLVLDYQKDFCF